MFLSLNPANIFSEIGRTNFFFSVYT
uniref:Uncharacterized protein n=1 Tax=Rhizophora mucronata TaxID=61149 RepID=A0A2P2NDS5_RHIMU